MPAINPISQVQSALIGQVLSRKKNHTGLAGLLEDFANAQLLEQIVRARPRRQARRRPSEAAIADRFEFNARKSRAGSRNASLGVNRANTASVAMENVREITNRLSELSIMASDPLLNDGDRIGLNEEAQQLKSELIDLENNTTFNGSPILQGSTTSTFTGDGSVSTTDADLSGINASLAALDFSTQASSEAAITDIEEASKQIGVQTARSGANENRLQRASDLANVQADNTQAAAENIRSSNLGEIGSLFGEELTGVVEELFGFRL